MQFGPSAAKTVAITFRYTLKKTANENSLTHDIGKYTQDVSMEDLHSKNFIVVQFSDSKQVFIPSSLVLKQLTQQTNKSGVDLNHFLFDAYKDPADLRQHIARELNTALGVDSCFTWDSFTNKNIYYLCSLGLRDMPEHFKKLSDKGITVDVIKDEHAGEVYFVNYAEAYATLIASSNKVLIEMANKLYPTEHHELPLVTRSPLASASSVPPPTRAEAKSASSKESKGTKDASTDASVAAISQQHTTLII